MKKIFKLFVSVVMLVLVAAVTACATAPVSDEESAYAPRIPHERIFFTTTPKSTNPPARVIFIRDVGFTGTAVDFHLSLDGKRDASLAPGERWEIELAPGVYLFGVIPTNILGEHAEYVLDQTLLTGQEYHYRLLAAIWSGVRIQRSSVVNRKESAP